MWPIVTDHVACYMVCNNRPHLHDVVLRCSLKMPSAESGNDVRIPAAVEEWKSFFDSASYVDGTESWTSTQLLCTFLKTYHAVLSAYQIQLKMCYCVVESACVPVSYQSVDKWPCSDSFQLTLITAEVFTAWLQRQTRFWSPYSRTTYASSIEIHCRNQSINHSHINLVHQFNHEWLRRIWSCSKITWHMSRLYDCNGSRWSRMKDHCPSPAVAKEWMRTLG